METKDNKTQDIRYAQDAELTILVELQQKEIVALKRQIDLLQTELKTFNDIAATDYNETLRHLYTTLEYITTNDAHNLSNSGKANIRRAQSAIQRMKLLTEDFLVYSDLDSAEMECQDIDLGLILQARVQKLSRELSDTELYIDKSEMIVNGSPVLLSMLFHQLLDNAIKFKRTDGSHRVDINFGPWVEGYHIVSIADNGIGFPETEAENIFRIFYRLHERNKYKGSGIGLSIVRKIMHMHGGFVLAKSRPEQGAIFFCHFPAKNNT